MVDTKTKIRVNRGELPSKKIKLSAHRGQSGAPRRLTTFTVLKSFPLDVVFEIFSHLDPLDILHLSRTTKDFRQLLLGRSGCYIWKSAFRNVPELPECPEDMSLPAWANLVFDLHCHECGKAHYKNVVNFILRIRLCKGCAKNVLMSEKSFNAEDPQDNLFLRCIPFAHWNKDKFKSCLEGAESDFLCQLPDSLEAQNAYARRSRKDVKARFKHGKRCHAWLNGQASERDKGIEEMKVTRQTAIMDRLRGLGYNEEVDYIPTRDYSARLHDVFDPDHVPFEKHPVVKVARPLTDQMWSKIESKMIEHVGQVTLRIVRHKRHRLVEARKELALQAWFALRPTLGPTLLVPSPVDILALPRIDHIIESSPEAGVTQQMFEHAINQELEFELVQRFRSVEIEKLAAKIPGVYFPFGSTAERALKLATSVFVCKSHMHFSSNDPDTVAAYEKDHQLPLFYPEFLYHPCNSMRRRASFHGKGEYEKYAIDNNMLLGVDKQYRNCRKGKWSSEELVTHDKARSVVRKILEACGLSASRTTVARLDELDPRLICLKCTYGGKADGERICSVWSWRNAVKHCLKVHWGGAVQWQMILQEDAEKARTLELLEPARRSLPAIKSRPWRCTLCIDTPSDCGRMDMEKLTDHFSESHANHEGQLEEGPHYYRALEAPLPRVLTVKMVPQAVPASECQSD